MNTQMRTAVITGAAQGLGRVTAETLVEAGFAVMLLDLQPLDAIVTELRAKGHTAHGLSGDIADEAFVQQAAAEVALTMGSAEVLVNNAGISVGSSVFAEDDDFLTAWDNTLAVNVSAQAHFIRLVVPYMRSANIAGRIINIASTEAIVATPGLAAYTAAKHGVVGLTKSMATQLGRYGITVNAVCPGPINTNMTADIPTDAKAKYAHRKVPLKRYGEPEEVAHMTLNLAMPASSFVNGAVVVVDGGMTIQH